MAEEGKAPMVAAEFDAPEPLIAAAASVREREFGELTAYTPLPVPGLVNALGRKPPRASRFAIAGYVFGIVLCFGLICYATLYAYPINVGGRPLFSWPYYIVPTDAIGLLFGALFLLIGFLVMTGLPRLHHPAFDIPGFERASANRFFLCIQPESPKADAAMVERFLRALPNPPLGIHRVRP